MRRPRSRPYSPIRALPASLPGSRFARWSVKGIPRRSTSGYAVALGERRLEDAERELAETLHDEPGWRGGSRSCWWTSVARRSRCAISGRSDPLPPERRSYSVGAMRQRTGMPTIRFDATLYTIDEWTILRLPEKASGKLSSRGQVAVQGTINGHGFQTVLEPDGDFGHWMRIDGELRQAAALSAGDTATVEIESLEDWPEPNVPQDLEAALAAAPQTIRDLWIDITPMARWEWVRWVNATRNPDTRKRRVEVSISKMKSGKRRPCCFNLAACTDPNLSRNGRLSEPA